LETEGTISKAIGESTRIDVELKRLQEENRQLKMERDILKMRRSSLPEKALEMPIHLCKSNEMANYNPVPSPSGHVCCVLQIHAE
jgi:regulator of replication initiation timing